MNPIHARASELHAKGIAVLPIHQHDPEKGDKRPAIAWKRLQTTRLAAQEIDMWFGSGDYGIGVVMGEISGGLMLIELEGEAAHRLADLTSLAKDSGLDDLWQRMFGWCETTPSGGYHWYVYAPGNTHGNRKLARTAHGEVLAETRENGGYSVVAPLDGERFHHTGQGSWQLVQGGPATAGTFTLDELDDLLAVFRTLDDQPEPATSLERTPPAERDPHAGITPGDDYENQTTWAEILQPHGWTRVFTRGNETFWRRPGKKTGISASTGHATDRDRLYVWSTSTIFDTEVPYTKFGAYTLLEHDGDHHKAAKQLYDDGYGRQAEHPRDTTGLNTWINAHNSPLQATTPPNSTHLPDTTENPPQAHTDTPTAIVTEPDTYTRTDDGNALRFADQNQGRLRYIPERKKWVVWNGHQWSLNNGNQAATEAAKTTARNLPTDNKADQNHRTRSLSKTAINAITTLAATTPGIYTPITNFDANPYTLNTPNGTINLTTGQLTPPDPNTLHLRSTAVPADFTMPTPRWHQFLAQTFTNDTTLIDYIQRLFGLAILGEVREQLLPFFHGTGANGKTTMINVIQHILGVGETGYTLTSPADIITKTDQHPTAIAALSGVRLAVIAELEEGRRIAEAKVKELTGGDNITARFMGQDFFTYTPTHTLIVLTNSVPETNAGGSPALWRRIKRVPFLNVVPKDERNPNLENELLEEAPGILAWISDGTINYLASGLREPEIVRVATAEYEGEQNTVAQWVGECCDLVEPSTYNQIAVRRVYESYERWCRYNGVEPVSSRSFGRRLKAHGVTNFKSHGQRYYAGIVIKEEISDMDGVL